MLSKITLLVNVEIPLAVNDCRFTSVGSPKVNVLSVTDVSISPAVPANVIVCPVLTVSVVPLSADIPKLLTTSPQESSPVVLVFK